MPFTPSHAAAVLPLVGRAGLVPAALVIGSMAPDLPYYLQLGTESSLTHSLVGVVTVDLLMALAVFAAWQALVAPASYAAGPAGLRARLAPPIPLAAHLRTPRAAAWVVASLVIGGLTHVVWDAFTHHDRWGTNAIPWLTEQHGRLEGYRWAQYASSGIGLAIVGLLLLRWWRQTAPARRSDAERPLPSHRAEPQLSARAAAAYWLAVLVTSAVAASAGVLSAVATDVGLRRGVFRALVWGGGAGLLALLLASLVVVTLARRRASAGDDPSS